MTPWSDVVGDKLCAGVYSENVQLLATGEGVSRDKGGEMEN